MNSSTKLQSTDISMQELELSQLFQEQYNDIFHEILQVQQNQFISNLTKQVLIMAKILKKNYNDSIIKNVLIIFNKIYLNDKNQCLRNIFSTRKFFR